MDIIEKLRGLRENGTEIIEDEFCIMYNPFIDQFMMDIPSFKKDAWLNVEGFDEPFNFDCSGFYPIATSSVCDRNYEKIWEELEPYVDGATFDMLPYRFKEDGVEYTFVTDEEGQEIPVELRKMTMIKFNENGEEFQKTIQGA